MCASLLPNNFLHSVSLVTFPVWETGVFNYWVYVALGVTQIIRAVMAAVPRLPVLPVSAGTFPDWRRTAICTRTGAAKGLFSLKSPALVSQVCAGYEGIPWHRGRAGLLSLMCRAHPKPAMLGNVPPSPWQPRQVLPSPLKLPSYRTPQVVSAGHLYWIFSHKGLLSLSPACFPNSS